MRKIKPFMKERNFIILMIGVFINGLGQGIYSVAGMLLVLQLSGSILYSGIAFFAITSAGAMSFFDRTARKLCEIQKRFGLQ